LKDFVIPIAADFAILGEDQMNIDEATEIIFEEKGWPLLGGPSGRGASYWSTAQRCPRLFQASYDNGRVDERLRQDINKATPIPLQIGALFHTLQALYYAAGLGENCVVAADRGGLCRVESAGRGRRSLWSAPADAADQLVAALKKMCGVDDLEVQLKASLKNGALPVPEGRAPNLQVVLEAERLFDAHCNHWGKSEDVQPLAIEWFALDEQLGYTCRYDLIGRVGADDPVIPPGVYIFEKKTAGWIDEKFLEGWSMDLEILGELHCWERSGCTERFGELSGVVMDCVSKAKIPECRRIVIPATIPQVDDHARWIRYTQAQIAIWRATETYPQNFSACHGRYGRCGNWDACTLGTSTSNGE
jgi:hypothetical protein